MQYDNTDVRRQDRLLEEEQAYALLKNGEYGVLSMIRQDGEAYGIPVNFVWNGSDAIYIHCAPEGEKLRCLAVCSKVSFCVVGKTCVLSAKFTTEYESIVIRAHARTGLLPEERMQALELLLDKYSPADKAVGLKYAEGSFHRTEIIRLDIQAISGKCKRVR